MRKNFSQQAHRWIAFRKLIHNSNTCSVRILFPFAVLRHVGRLDDEEID